MQILWKSGFAPKGVTAETAHEVIQNLQAQGKKTAKDLVEASRPEDAPLHSLFEWDDAVAAEKYREEQARVIIRHIAYEEEQEGKNPVQVRAFFQIDNASSDYEPTVKIMTDDEKYRQLLATATRELKWFRDKYRTLKELNGVFAAIDQLTQEESDNEQIL